MFKKKHSLWRCVQAYAAPEDGPVAFIGDDGVEP